MGHTSGALAPRNSVGCVRRRQDAIFLFTFDWRGSDPTPVGCLGGVFVACRRGARRTRKHVIGRAGFNLQEHIKQQVWHTGPTQTDASSR